MNLLSLLKIRHSSPAYLASLLSAIIIFSQSFYGQRPQLSLADILIGLRSKKVTLVERNKILAGAVKERGITFALTPEIEKELAAGGADKDLIAAIEQKSQIIKISAVDVKPEQPATAPAVTEPNAAFFHERANSAFVKGEFDSALADYTKVIEMKAADASVYINRGIIHANRNSLDRSVADFDRAIEIDPKDPRGFLHRGRTYEKVGNVQKALSDYEKALALDANNATAKANILRLKPEPVKPEPTPATVEDIIAKTPEPVKPPEILEVGAMNNLATRLVMPVYPPLDRRMKIQGLVVVQISLDIEGKVTSVTATSGPKTLRSAAEDAARKSKFKPARYNEMPIRSTGFISYNFKADQYEE